MKPVLPVSAAGHFFLFWRSEILFVEYGKKVSPVRILMAWYGGVEAHGLQGVWKGYLEAEKAVDSILYVVLNP